MGIKGVQSNSAWTKDISTIILIKESLMLNAPTQTTGMQFKVIIILFTLATTGYAHDIDNNDIPLPCHDVCQPVLNLTADCDRRIVDDDSATYRDCICQAQNAQSDVPNCAACVSANGGTDFDDDDDTTPDNGKPLLSTR